VEPLRPEERELILQTRPEATPQDIDEYQRLLAERFLVDPSLPRSPESDRVDRSREERIHLLYQKLFN